MNILRATRIAVGINALAEVDEVDGDERNKDQTRHDGGDGNLAINADGVAGRRGRGGPGRLSGKLVNKCGRAFRREREHGTCSGNERAANAKRTRESGAGDERERRQLNEEDGK